MCLQDHSSLEGIDSIKEKFDAISKSLLGLKNRGKDSVSINIMGGELLQDSLPDTVFKDYELLINRIRNFALDLNFPIEMHIASNMIWNKTERVAEFLNKTNMKLNASFDPTGRFNPQTFEIFKRNVVDFKNYIDQIGTVMTRPTIKKFMNDKVEFFDYLYENFQVVFDHYTPEVEGVVFDNQDKFANILLPRDTDLRDFYKFMFDNYPNCFPFNELSLNTKQPMSCMGTVTIQPNSTVGSCSTYNIQKGEFKVMFGKLHEHKNQWLKDYDCLSCEYMQKCSFGCFLNHHKKNIRTQEACWLKEVYDYVEGNPKC
jgi:radical SAM protein with 4Fe4S-binding SPASM domain